DRRPDRGTAARTARNLWRRADLDQLPVDPDLRRLHLDPADPSAGSARHAAGRAMTALHGKSLAIYLAAAALLALPPLFAGPYYLGVGLALLSWIALAQSWVLLSGMTGYISLGHAMFYGLGGYLTVLTWQSWPLWISLPAAGLLAASVALLLGWPVLRVRGPYLVILTYGLAELVKFIVIDIEAKLGKFGRLLMGAPPIETLYWLMLALALVSTLATWYVRRSRFGAGLRAIRENEEAAETLGVPSVRFKLTAFA